MRLLKMHVDNFGRLHDFNFNFEEGLNVILEENGWGKTTMAAFLKAMLYGLEPGSFDRDRDRDRALRDAGPYTYQLRLVHGFHRGTSLQSMIQDEYRYHAKVLRIQPGDNPGVTILVLKELY